MSDSEFNKTAYIVLAVWLPFLLLAQLLLPPIRYRRSLKIAVWPELEPTGEEDLSPPMRQFLGQAAPVLVGVGFTPRLSVHARDFGAGIHWTQALFVNPQTGDRASIMAVDVGATHVVNLIFATELREHAPLTTGVPVGPFSAADLRYTYDAHRKKVAADPLAAQRPIVPAIGGEAEWLSERAARVAADFAKKLRFRADERGQWYVPTWRGAFGLAWHNYWLRKFVRRMRGEKCTSPRQADSFPPAFPVSPVSTEPK